MSTDIISIRELFDPEFVESVSRLKILARRVAPSGSPAEKRSRQKGSGMEFRDYRQYTPGDDFSAIDWNVYQRLGRVFLRLFEEQRDLPVYITPDISASMFHGDQPRVHAALRCAFALSSIALREHDSVGIFPFSDSLQTALRPTGGKGRLMRVAQTLSRIEPGGATDFAESIRKFRHLNIREGLMVVISDFFDPKGLEAVCDALKLVRHRLLLVQLVRKSDADPQLQGDLLLKDCESGEEQNVSVTKAVLDSYKKSWADFHERLGQFATQRQAGIVRIDVEEDIVGQLATLFESGAYVV
ncbi:MAG: hypothetical protein ACI97A_003532 [Planctomycetota bacterium]|jgi:uncharacterized protein (DUF58 family)